MLLEIKDVSKSFQGLQVFKGITLSIPKTNGKKPPLVGIIGPNGAGKTTLFNILTGYEKADSGSVTFRGHRIDGKKPFEIVKARFGRTFQNTLAFKGLTVWENVLVASYLREEFNLFERFIFPLFSLKLTKRKNKNAEDKVQQILSIVDLIEEKNIISGNLPYGKQKKLGVAMALATNPELLALDEPAAGLNPGEALEMIKLLQKINESGIALLVIEHNMKLVMNLCEIIYVLSNGQIIAEGKPESIARNQQVIEVYLGKGMVANGR